MYIPAPFQVDDPSVLHAFMRVYSFATLITSGVDPFVTHLPLLLDPQRGQHGTIVGHFARTNPHWQLDHHSQRTVAIFQGPHAYISPAWYRSRAPAVPTWNYAVVHAAGEMTIIEDPDRVGALLDRTVRTYEAGFPDPWVNPLTREANSKLIAAVVAFELPIDRLEGKFKFGQNRTPEERCGMVEGLEASGNADSTALASFIRKHLNMPAAR